MLGGIIGWRCATAAHYCESDTLGFNSRVRWIVKPGTDIYLILNQDYVVETKRKLTYMGSDATIKARVAWRL